MGFHREHRLDSELNRLLDDLSRPERDKLVDVPGKRTRVLQLVEQLTLQGRSEHASAPGRRTLVERLVAMASPLQFDDFRVLALRNVLGAIGGRSELRDATVAAADRDVARRAIPVGPTRPTTADAEGHAMWQAAERRAATLYRHALDAGEVAPDDPQVEAALARAGSGAPLPAAVRRKMEDELGVSLDRVRVHTDPVAAKAAQALHAEAFTVGEDIFFAAGTYAPESRAGQKLLAHELTHVVQSWQGRSEAGDTRRVSQPGDSLEREADAVADQVAAGPDRPAGNGDLARPAKPGANRARRPITPRRSGRRSGPGCARSPARSRRAPPTRRSAATSTAPARR